MPSNWLQKVKTSVKENLWYAIWNFTLVVVFIQAFSAVFGPENNIVAVIFAIMMSASMARDLTAAPWKHLLLQALTLVSMTVAACLVNNLGPLMGLWVNLVMLFIILYAYTYEYASHLYFPYILSYLFLMFISPITPQQLPKRVLGMLVGAVCIMLYQFAAGRKRVVNTARDELTALLDMASGSVAFLLDGDGVIDPEDAHRSLCVLSKTVYERRKRVLCISDANFAMIDVGRGLERLILLLHGQTAPLSPERQALLKKAAGCLDGFRDFVNQKAPLPDPPEREAFAPEGADGFAAELYSCLVYVRDHLMHMTDPDKRARYRETALSLEVRLEEALDLSPVRFFYALRTALLLAVLSAVVLGTKLPHGRWLLFTVASLSLPYADDVGAKTKKRIAATVIGGLISVAAYGLVPSVPGRTAIMMGSGFVSFFLRDYTGTFACSTIGALGGAVMMSAFEWGELGSVFLIRLGYICAGALIAYGANCLLLPFTRKTATRQLRQKYAATAGLLERVCRADPVDPQLYYSLVIRSYLLDAKLCQNAAAEGLDGMEELEECRRKVREAHRHHLVSHCGALAGNSGSALGERSAG